MSDPSPELLAHAGLTRDMVPHLGTLSRLASGAEVVAELGVRSGVSTWALLDGLPPSGRLLSVDTDELAVPPRVYEDERWQFLQADDLSPEARGFLAAGADLVFIDTSHELTQTWQELLLAESLGAGVIALHDAGWPGVALATLEFLAKRGGYHVSEALLAGEATKRGGWRDFSLVVLRRDGVA